MKRGNSDVTPDGGDSIAQTVSYKQIQEYKQALDNHTMAVNKLIELNSTGYIEKSLIESLIVKPILESHTYVSKFLKDNNLISFDCQHEQKRLASIIDSMVKV